MSIRLRDTIQDCNINFLMGSGLSSPYLRTLGSIEALLTELDQSAFPPQTKKLIRASLYKCYFDGVISKNAAILANDPAASDVFESYRQFLHVWNSILLRRKSTILSKEVNLFTTNVDIFLEKALEDLSLEFNDGFNGRFRPSFSLSNFKKSRFKRSLHYDNTAEIPVFNLLKLHGSLSWEMGPNSNILFSCDLSHVRSINSTAISPDHILTVPDKATLASLKAAAAGKTCDTSTDAFLTAYEKFLIVNPTKEKFKHTLLNQTYYELLRLYSNELEKENTVLFVMGFSFADEHIREITLRAANSNPTLVIYVIAHSSSARTDIERLLGAYSKNGNIKYIQPPPADPSPTPPPDKDKFKYDLKTITEELFRTLFQAEEDSEKARNLNPKTP